jgi:hypothetical protein
MDSFGGATTRNPQALLPGASRRDRRGQLGRRRPTKGNLGGTNATRWTTTTKGPKEL